MASLVTKALSGSLNSSTLLLVDGSSRRCTLRARKRTLIAVTAWGYGHLQLGSHAGAKWKRIRDTQSMSSSTGILLAVNRRTRVARYDYPHIRPAHDAESAQWWLLGTLVSEHGFRSLLLLLLLTWFIKHIDSRNEFCISQPTGWVNRRAHSTLENAGTGRGAVGAWEAPLLLVLRWI